MSHKQNGFYCIHARLTQAFGVPLSTIIPMAGIIFGINVGTVLLLHRSGIIKGDVAQMKTLVLIGSAAFMLGGNLLAYKVLTLICRRIIQPWRHMTQLIQHGRELMTEERGELPVAVLSLRDMAGEMALFASYAEDAYRKYHAVKNELTQSRQMMAHVVSQQQTILASTNREIIEQYRNVLAYANYLDEHIERQQADGQLRYDFDDVCESSFNLKLIAQSLELMRRNEVKRDAVHLASLLQQTLISLTPSLDRRSMKLSTLGVDDTLAAHTDLQLAAHALWIMLLGTIRYAAHESTLRLRCHRAADNSQAVISIVISELEPGQLSPQERHAHLARQLQHVTPHMFAETIRLHANTQLAEWLLAAVEARISVLPITSYACEISLILPISK